MRGSTVLGNLVSKAVHICTLYQICFLTKQIPDNLVSKSVLFIPRFVFQYQVILFQNSQIKGQNNLQNYFIDNKCLMYTSNR